MILGHEGNPEGSVLFEIDAAVRALTSRTIYFNAHNFPDRVPRHDKNGQPSIVYNLENCPPVHPAVYRNHVVWDFSKKNAEKNKFIHVPIGYHPNMERFQPAPAPDIDVVFTGLMNERRWRTIETMRNLGLSVTVVEHEVGAGRNAILARAKLALAMLYYEHGSFTSVRCAHLAANRIPILAEFASEYEAWAKSGIELTDFSGLPHRAKELVRNPSRLQEMAARAYVWFRNQPMRLPFH